jgi:hypothetical protein
MFIRIFKLITSLLVIVVLGVLIAKRDFLLSGKETLQRPAPPTLKDSQQRNPTPLPQVLLWGSKTIATTSETAVVTKVTEPTKTPDIIKSEVYVAMNEGHSDTNEISHPLISPCKVAIDYKIGTFDTHFGVSKEKFKEEVQTAAAAWNQAAGKDLLVYDENGSLTINLIYDERQATTENVNYLALEIENSKTSANILRLTYEQEKIIYVGDGEQLTKDSEAFQVRYKAYADKVDIYNGRGGAPRDEYDAMTKELESLKTESKNLEVQRGQLLAFMDTINTKVNRYNELVSYINTLIKKSNALGTKRFTEGRFTPSTNTIDIYQYNDLIKLQRVITHEFGHALGISHNNNVQSIMYSVNSASTTSLSEEDIQALQAVCSKN